MPAIAQRDALATLSRKRLYELAVGFEVDVPARAAKDDIVDALARSRRAPYERILETLARDELKAICRAGGLDDSGKTKASIADRILGREEPSVTDATETTNGRRNKSGVARDGGDVTYEVEAGNGKLTLQGLESHLWGAANILRGSIDAADFKHYIFGLLFYKRLCVPARFICVTLSRFVRVVSAEAQVSSRAAWPRWVA